MKRAATKRMKPVRAWAVYCTNAEKLGWTFHPKKKEATQFSLSCDRIVRVEIREVAKGRKKARTK